MGNGDEMDPVVPTEFAAFVRDIGVRAFDQLAANSSDLDPALRAVARSWSRLTAPQKSELLEKVIAITQETDKPAAPPRKGAAPSRRYAPEEVEPTLPKVGKKKKKKAKPA